jgi:hypothetical protein
MAWEAGVVNLPYHIGALGALLDGLEEEAGRLAVVLLDEAPVREHRRQVVGEDAPLQRQQVASLLRRRLELCLLLPHRCAGRDHITRVNQSEIASPRKHKPPENSPTASSWWNVAVARHVRTPAPRRRRWRLKGADDDGARRSESARLAAMGERIRELENRRGGHFEKMMDRTKAHLNGGARGRRGRNAERAGTASGTRHSRGAFPQSVVGGGVRARPRASEKNGLGSREFTGVWHIWW